MFSARCQTKLKLKVGDLMGLDDEEANDEVSDLENKEAWAKRKASTMSTGSALVSTLEGVQVVRSEQKS